MGSSSQLMFVSFTRDADGKNWSVSALAVVVLLLEMAVGIRDGRLTYALRRFMLNDRMKDKKERERERESATVNISFLLLLMYV